MVLMQRDVSVIILWYYLIIFSGVQFEATEVATEESEDSEVGGVHGRSLGML